MLAKATDSRRIVYRLALASGLRRQELDDLLWGDLRLMASPAAGGSHQARRGDRLELPASLADDLRKVKTQNAKDNDRVFPDGALRIEDWKADLAAAEIPYKDEMGRHADFHGGTRKTLCNRMHRANVPLAAAMRRMRTSMPV